ncbi:hypothetical protein IBG28_20205 [Marinomonas arctica]|uniref:Uncharacterized protein n=1 Tax=Marinomonas arctica TaxID=383750 RepID=A0A7H1J607_9GAMM|nr:hypothetical protein [Marinomonas sp. BSi20414]QNT05923.1 hypothetical protein IBG28_20205 [Marinomonas arctica]
MRSYEGQIIGVCLLACWPLFAFSEERVAETEAEFFNNEMAETSWWLSFHESISETIGDWSESIDTFLSGKQSSREQNSDSNLQIRFGSVLSEYDSERSGFFEFRTRLKLPNTQDRLRLIVESEPDSLAPERLRGESTQQNSVVNSALKSNISAAIRYIKDDIGLDIDTGIRVDIPLDPFIRFRFNQHGGKDQWNWRQSQEAFAYYSKGVGARYGVGVSYALRSNLSLGTDFGITWLDKEGEFYARENFFVQHRLDEKNRISYQLSFLQSGEHSIEPDSFLYNLQYERLLYKDWLIGQVKPQFTHEADEDYEGKLSLTLSLAILLGPKYLY